MYLDEHQCRRSGEEYRTREGYIQTRVALILTLEDEQVQPDKITDQQINRNSYNRAALEDKYLELCHSGDGIETSTFASL